MSHANGRRAVSISLSRPACRSRSSTPSPGLRSSGSCGICCRSSHGWHNADCPPLFPFLVGCDLRHSARPVKIQMRVHVLAIEHPDCGGVICSDVTIADVLTNHRGIFRFNRPVVVGITRPRLRLLGQQLFNNAATVWLMNSLSSSEWKPRMRKGNCVSLASSTGISDFRKSEPWRRSLAHG